MLSANDSFDQTLQTLAQSRGIKWIPIMPKGLCTDQILGILIGLSYLPLTYEKFQRLPDMPTRPPVGFSLLICEEGLGIHALLECDGKELRFHKKQDPGNMGWMIIPLHIPCIPLEIMN